MMKTRVGIVGCGYVGTGLYQMFAGRTLISRYDPAKFYTDEAGVLESDVVFIAVPTPQAPDGSCDTSIVERAVAQFKNAKLICIKSTVAPGTTDRLISKYGKHIHFSPEYMGEGGNYVPVQYPDPQDARSHPFCIVGGHRADEVLAVFQRVMATSARYVATTALCAELAKYMENAYLATKVAFCNEFASICEAHGASYAAVRDLWLSDPRVDPSHTLVFADQRGYSGKCLPKDVSAIQKSAWDNGGVRTPLLDGVAAYDLHRKERMRYFESEPLPLGEKATDAELALHQRVGMA